MHERFGRPRANDGPAGWPGRAAALASDAPGDHVLLRDRDRYPPWPTARHRAGLLKIWPFRHRARRWAAAPGRPGRGPGARLRRRGYGMFILVRHGCVNFPRPGGRSRSPAAPASQSSAGQACRILITIRVSHV
jgi:hypothetical protein